MKALTVKQPWAELIVSGRRKFEIRTWKTEYKGWLLIHAGRKIDEEAMRHFEMSSQNQTLGAIVGKVFIEDYVSFTPESWEAYRPEHMEWTAFQAGIVGWRLNQAVKFEKTIPWNGSLGLFEIPDSALSNEISGTPSGQLPLI